MGKADRAQARGVRPRSALLREARVGDLVPADVVATGRPRRLEATAVLVPGPGGLDAYRRELDAHADDFAAWDGRVVMLDPDGARPHAVVIVDRYGQVYDTAAGDVGSLPTPRALEEWFRFLGTACPECGVIDDPRQRDWVA